MNVVEVSLIRKNDLSKLMEIEAYKIGWVFSHYDVDFYFEYPANKIFSITVDGEVAGCIILHESFGTIRSKKIISVGFFMVIDKFRGKKTIGPYLWAEITKIIDSSNFICFNSVPRALSFYEKNGFSKTTLFSTTYILHTNKYNKKQSAMIFNLFETGALHQVNEKETDGIDIYNLNLFPGNSGAGFRHFINKWIKRPDAITVTFSEDGVIKGYGVITICKIFNIEGQVSLYSRISPLYADTPDIALSILQGLIYYGLSEKHERIMLCTLRGPSTAFSSDLVNLGFIENGTDYVVSNHAQAIRDDAEILKKIFSILPLEYPSEVVSCLV